MVRGAIQALKEHGFAGASARAIARAGGFNQALIFYHFHSVNDLLLAALDQTSEERMARYRKALDGVADLQRLVRIAADIYREDLESGHITVLAELIAGASSVPELGPQIVERMAPWIEFTRDAVDRALGGSPLQRLLPVQDVAYAIVAFYLGVELLTHLNGQDGRVEGLFAQAKALAGVLDGLIGGGQGGG